MPFTPLIFGDSSSGDWLPYVLPAALIVWLLVLGTLLVRTDLDPVTKLMWVIVVIFVPIFGILFYWFLEPKAVAAFTRKEKKIDPANQLSGTPWEGDPGHTAKGR
jgi:hypothetical protein